MAVQRMSFDIEMMDGTIYEDVKSCLADQALYSRTRKVQKWDSPADDPLTFMNFLAFAALKREGKFEGDYNKFINECAAVGESGEFEEVHPTK